MGHFSVRAENKMPEGRGSSTSSRGAGLAGSEDIMDLLPLRLVRSQVIPPAPNRRESSIDWLPEFGGASWIAYGASSLLVISHFPSPFSGNEPQLGPFFRQVIEPPTGNKPAELTTVSWCPVQPSEGEIAVALGNNIFMYSPVTSSAPGSFSWRQTVVIVETFPIEIIGWTGSGDGLVAAGTEVVLWIRKSNLWEMTWKVRTAVPQTHVSASWFSDGLVATAAQALVHPDEVSAKESNYTLPQSTKHVSVYFRDGKSGTTTVQLYHPQPIVMIQWRPHIGVQSQADASSAYNILLTCCLDGTVRLWSEIDNGRLRKFNKEIHDQKSMKRLFHVVAVIEMNQSLKGTLGTNIFVKWALDFSCAVFKGESGGYSLLPIYTEHQQIGKCDWLIGIGPDFSVTFWAIHCLDDVSPPRFPRVTMWKKGHLMDFKDSKYPYFGSPNTKNQAILVKVVASRSWLCGPPIACSLLQLLPGNSFSWLELYNPSEKMEDTSLRQINKERSLSCIAHTALSELGHTGCIIQVAVHPCSFDISLSVSLDSNGLLLFWSLSTLSESILPFHTHIHPMWKLLDHISLKVLSSDHEYSCLVWGPAVLNENRFLLVGHEDGIDCFMIEVSCKEESISAHKVLTIPFNGYNDKGNPPDQIFAIPLIPNSRHSSNSSSFLLVCVWRENYKPLSWTIDLDMSINDGVSSNDNGLAISKGQCTSSSGKFCYAAFYKHSFELPSPHCWDGVTTVTVASPTSCPLPIEQVYSNDSPSSYCGYHMATGYSGGTVKLWRICHMQQDHSDSENVPWELAGTFTAHEGPVNFLSLSSCSSKVATASIDGRNSTTSLHIWEFVKLTCGGSFVLEDAIDLNGILIAVRWLALGNGQMLLGICLPNEFRVYSQRRLSTHSFANSDTSKEMHTWYCIAVSGSSTIVRDFLWGPKLTAVIVHEKHFSVCSQWLLGTNSTYNVEDSVAYVGRIEESLLCATNTGKNMLDIDEQLAYGYSKKISQQDYVPNTENKLFYILDVSRKLGGALALYDPEALIQYIYSGNWKYALVILKNFVECICSYKTSTTIPESDKQSLLSCKKLEVHLARYIEDNNSENSSSEKLFWGQNITTSGPNFHLGGNELQFLNTHLETNTYERIPDNSNKSEIMELIDTLEKSNQVSSLTNLMKTQILVILELLNEINNTKATAAYGSLDEAGRRFWVAVRFQYLYSMRRSGGVVTEDLPVNSRLAAWAFQSDCQDDLLNSVLSSDPSWVDMRNLGVGLWYTNASQLRTRMEKLARSEYLRNKNPKDCALWYLALNRLQVLISLFKISKDEKDKVLFGFLSRNFQDERNKAAALKNAYVLMGKHELKLAIAFFLLGGDSSSAVNVCAKNLGDDQLALVICRLLEGYGGSLEKQLISNILLPKALEKGDYWLSSLLEWTLGNYSQSVKTLVNGQTKQVNRNSAALCNYGALSDPDIGHYCVILASRNSFRCSVGENVAADLSKFASFLAASALNRCGVPLEALACLSYSLSSDGKDRKNVSTAGPHDIFHQILSPFTGDAYNWVLDNVSHQLEVNTKTNIALYYIDSFLRNHPVWSSHSLSKSREVIGCHYVYLQEEDLSQMKQDLQMILSMFERKFLLKSVDIFNLVLLSAHNYGSLFLGYLMLHVEEFTRNEYKNWSADLIFVPAFVRLLVKSTVEILCFLARFVVSFNFTESMLKPLHDNHYQIHTILFCLKNMLCFIRTFGSSSNYYQGEKASEDFSTFFPFALDLLEFYVDFAFACIEGNFKGLFMMINHILIALANDESSIEVLSDELRKFLCQNSQLVIHCASAVEVESISNSNFKQKHLETGDLPIADDEKWKLLWISLWLHMLNFAKHGLGKISIKEGSHNSSINNIITVFISAITKSLVSTIAYVSSSLVKLVASFLRQKALKGLPIPSILWLDEIARSHPTSLHYCLNQRLDSLQLTDNKTQVSLKMLWDISICPVDICEHFAKEKVSCFPYYHGNQFDTWKDVQRNIFSENENDHINDKQEKLDSGSSYKETISGHGGSTMDNNGFVETGRKHSGPRTDISYFHNPREVTRRSGELFEAICFNSINEHEIAITSNKKGLIFFNLKYEEYSRKQADYIWSDCDWPKDGWAGSESTPVPTYISQGIGLGSKRGVHLGLGGATIGIGSLARPRRDLTGGGAFGIPGYAGIGAAGLGWGEEEFEEFRDPPATVENIHSRALTRHPLLPFLLVGSSNTHVYLWEFGKQSAVATYGVLPAANVPPPYALASISALQFDHYGHRFATAALDGTICTWQLEVGGRSNVHPTDSSLCFDNHASDVAYVATSGSILAVAGSSNNGINVVLWDTLAPPATSQASLFCHEGGARSVSVFDHVIGTGSISPIIVTGGRSGDVGLHDLRYIATGKTRRNRHASEQDLKTMHTTNSGISKHAENSNGMMWYIPKAHLGSVTRIATIPNTSLFLTGSKDGDVKLWDAKRSQLVFQWQKLHERHTFLQPNSRGFGGVVRAAVTDIQVLSRGFLTCGGDGSTKLIQLK